MIRFGEPVITKQDIESVRRVLESGWISSGKEVMDFENDVAKFLRVGHAVATSSGSAALDLAFQVLDIQPGDEVIAPAMTYIAPIATAVRTGAKVILADIDSYTGTISPYSVSKLVTNKTKLIIAVDYAGIPANYDELRKRVGNIPILEDGAEGLGGSLKNGSMVCAIGDIGIISFHSIKQVTCGEGGMLTTNSIYLADRARSIRNQGEGAIKYCHELVGNNYRMTDYAAALGRSQFSRIAHKVKKRRDLEKLYTRQLENHCLFHYGYSEPCLFFYPVLVGNRDKIVSALYEKDVETRLAFEPVYSQPAYADKVVFNPRGLDTTTTFCPHILALPLHEKLQAKDIEFIANIIKDSGDTGFHL